MEGAGQAGKGSRVLAQDPEQPAGADTGLEAVFWVRSFGVDRGEEVGQAIRSIETAGGSRRGTRRAGISFSRRGASGWGRLKV